MPVLYAGECGGLCTGAGGTESTAYRRRDAEDCARRGWAWHHALPDYRRGTADGLILQDGVLKLSGKGSGWFFSRVLDSRETEMLWHRLRVFQPGTTGGWNMTIYSSDSRMLDWENGSQAADECIADQNISLEEKKYRMKRCQARLIKGENDALLYDVRGRYCCPVSKM